MSATDTIKQRHRAMWASGDYSVIAEVVKPVSEHLVRACGVRAGQRVLDVAAGTGSSAIPAAQAGAHVIASDLTPELFEVGRARAAEAGVEVEWMEADAEALPFGDGEFDVVLSAIGAMFAPHHEAVASELLRVTRPGGTIGMANWTPDGQIGEMFKLMRPYAPPPPPGSQPPPLWGSEDHVRELLGEGCSELRLERHVMEVTAFATPEEHVETFEQKYGPTIAVLKNLDPDRRAEFDAAYLEFAERWNRGGAGGPARFEYEYLLVVGTRA
ncbi:MAG TPA: class I SAM-dependent methyltransferase [Solirubrobacteraceae bacterium]|jgi:SAM-dependent methyltransferase|nr:class I SAM-dependent methyltransferase [Solirubrobacteraceae bacterium]